MVRTWACECIVHAKHNDRDVGFNGCVKLDEAPRAAEYL